MFALGQNNLKHIYDVVIERNWFTNIVWPQCCHTCSHPHWWVVLAACSILHLRGLRDSSYLISTSLPVRCVFVCDWENGIAKQSQMIWSVLLCSGYSPWHDPDPVSSFACGFEKRHVPQPETLRLAIGCEIHTQTHYCHPDIQYQGSHSLCNVWNIVELERNVSSALYKLVCLSVWHK